MRNLLLLAALSIALPASTSSACGWVPPAEHAMIHQGTAAFIVLDADEPTSGMRTFTLLGRSGTRVVTTAVYLLMPQEGDKPAIPVLLVDSMDGVIAVDGKHPEMSWIDLVGTYTLDTPIGDTGFVVTRTSKGSVLREGKRDIAPIVGYALGAVKVDHQIFLVTKNGNAIQRTFLKQV